MRKCRFIGLAIVLMASVASAAGMAWPKDSASDLAVFVALLKFRIYADHCSARVPALKPGFDGLMENLDSRMQGISKALLAAGTFKDMKGKPVPAEILFAFKDSFEDAGHNFERQDAGSVCPKTLQSFAEVDDEALKSGLTEALAAIRNMIRNLEKGSHVQ